MESESLDDLERLHRAYRPALIRYFTRRTENHAEAEDLTQEVFIRLARSKPTTARNAEAYLLQIASNLLRDRARRAKVRADYRDEVVHTEGFGVEPIDPYRLAAGQGDLKALYEGLAQLPEKTRRIFTLYRIENVEKRVIAEAFGISTSAVEKHVTRAMGFLIGLLGDRP